MEYIDIIYVTILILLSILTVLLAIIFSLYSLLLISLQSVENLKEDVDESQSTDVDSTERVFCRVGQKLHLRRSLKDALRLKVLGQDPSILVVAN